jgi:hypothetical protein
MQFTKGMKLKDIIARQDKIIIGKEQLFIANKDFQFFGLAVLKDSIVYYNGMSELRVNLILLGIFGEKHVPALVKEQLHFDENYFYTEQVSNCPQECFKLDKGSWGVWHKDHFDQWNGTFEPFVHRVMQVPVLKYKGIRFSSLMYNYNVSRQVLDWFITAGDSLLDTDNGNVEVPSMLEVSRYPTLNSYDVIPLEGICVYQNIPLEGMIYIAPSGIVNGQIGETAGYYLGKSADGIPGKGTKVDITQEGRILLSA